VTEFRCDKRDGGLLLNKKEIGITIEISDGISCFAENSFLNFTIVSRGVDMVRLPQSVTVSKRDLKF